MAGPNPKHERIVPLNLAGAEGMFAYAHHSYRFRHANACKTLLECEPNTIYSIRVRPHPHTKPNLFKSQSQLRFEKIGRGRRNRTLIRGFGDRYSTVELCPCVPLDVPHATYSLRQNSTRIQKIKRKYYNIF